MMEAGTWPRRNPGIRASFWYFWIRASVSRETSSEGTSISISRFVLAVVSVGLTIYLSENRRWSLLMNRRLVVRRWSFAKTSRLHKNLGPIANIRILPTANDEPPTTRFSLCWSVVSVSAADLHSLVVGHNFNRPIPAVVSKICRTVEQCILTGQVNLNLRKRIGNILRLKRSKCATAGCVGDAFQDLVVLVRIARARIIRTDRINYDVSSERHFDGLLAGHVTLVIVAVADEHDCPPHRIALRGLQQLFPASVVECVVKSSRVARPQRPNTL